MNEKSGRKGGQKPRLAVVVSAELASGLRGQSLTASPMVVASGAVAGCRGPTGTALLERQLFVLLCMRSLPGEMIVIFERCVVCDIFFFSNNSSSVNDNEVPRYFRSSDVALMSM